jgi:hypothetical protein
LQKEIVKVLNAELLPPLGSKSNTTSSSALTRRDHVTKSIENDDANSLKALYAEYDGSIE